MSPFPHPFSPPQNLYAYSFNNPVNISDPSGMNPAIALPFIGAIAGITAAQAAQAAAAAAGLTVLACLADSKCAAQMRAAIEAAIAKLSSLLINILKAACDLQHEIYKAVEKPCRSCKDYQNRAKCFPDRLANCAFAQLNLACWTNAVAERGKFMISGCDFVPPWNGSSFGGHLTQLREKIGAARICLNSQINNCRILDLDDFNSFF
jgi:hypothetical protein